MANNLGFPENWGQRESEWYITASDRSGFDLPGDPIAMEYYHQSFFGFREGMTRESMAQMKENFYGYMTENYGVFWEDVFDIDEYLDYYE